MTPAASTAEALRRLARMVPGGISKSEGCLRSLDFTGRVVLVTGGSSGIGNGIARAFRAQNAVVHVCGTRGGAADYEGEEGSDLAGMTYHQIDLTDDAAVAAFDPGVERLDVLVCAQGISVYKRREFQMETFREVIDVNLNSVMALSTRFQPLLAAAKGSIIHVNSGAGFKAMIGNPAYGASKGGLRILTMSLAEAWAPDIRVNAIAPGYVDTRITKVTRDNPERYAATLESIPLKRWGTTDEMGNVALFLASDLASYITGQTIFVDGGKILS